MRGYSDGSSSLGSKEEDKGKCIPWVLEGSPEGSSVLTVPAEGRRRDETKGKVHSYAALILFQLEKIHTKS
ncbi:hypothetical protein RUM44_013497 [Polyplax serrata]|uniref:Uncharacterized protein n=1 Tax=Polyplax serrata TaxID=468196 RepID=A0ABR1BEN6_POLSC